jgi:hypothetical protein
VGRERERERERENGEIAIRVVCPTMHFFSILILYVLNKRKIIFESYFLPNVDMDFVSMKKLNFMDITFYYIIL